MFSHTDTSAFIPVVCHESQCHARDMHTRPSCRQRHRFPLAARHPLLPAQHCPIAGLPAFFSALDNRAVICPFTRKPGSGRPSETQQRSQTPANANAARPEQPFLLQTLTTLRGPHSLCVPLICRAWKQWPFTGCRRHGSACIMNHCWPPVGTAKLTPAEPRQPGPNHRALHSSSHPSLNSAGR